MGEYLFPRFLDDPREYEQAEALWASAWAELVARAGQQGQWQSPWLSTQFADGTPFHDGNPIFSAVSPTQRRGVRVIQHEPSQAAEDLSSWTDTFAAGEAEAIEEPVVSCALTRQTLSDALALMERWITARPSECMGTA